MQTLQEMLHARATGQDQRANVGVITIRGGAVYVRFGEVAGNPPVVLEVAGNAVELLHPRLPIAGEKDQAAGAGNEPPEPVDPDKHTRDELVAMAALRGVRHASNANKAEIAGAMNATPAVQ